MLIADYGFGNALLTVLSVFLFVAWIMVLFTILGDLFRDHEMSGGWKAVWVLFLIFIPFVTALVYLIARGEGMSQRARASQQQAQADMQEYIRNATGTSASTADELEKLAGLRDRGTITAEEFETQKAKLLA